MELNFIYRFVIIYTFFFNLKERGTSPSLMFDNQQIIGIDSCYIPTAITTINIIYSFNKFILIHVFQSFIHKTYMPIEIRRK